MDTLIKNFVQDYEATFLPYPKNITDEAVNSFSEKYSSMVQMQFPHLKSFTAQEEPKSPLEDKNGLLAFYHYVYLINKKTLQTRR